MRARDSGKFEITEFQITRFNCICDGDVNNCSMEYFLIFLLISTRDIGCDQMVKLLEGAQCPLRNGEYVVKHQTHKLPNVSILSFIQNVSKNVSKETKIDLLVCHSGFSSNTPPPQIIVYYIVVCQRISQQFLTRTHGLSKNQFGLFNYRCYLSQINKQLLSN